MSLNLFMWKEMNSPAGCHDEHVIVGPDQTGWRVAAGWASGPHYISFCKGLIPRLYWNPGHL